MLIVFTLSYAPKILKGPFSLPAALAFWLQVNRNDLDELNDLRLLLSLVLKIANHLSL